MPVALEIHHRGDFGQSAVRTLSLFADRAAADDAFETVKDAAQAYHNRANDREKMVTLETLTGPAAIDVSTIAVVNVDDALGEARAEVEAWNIGVAEIRAKSEAAAKAIASTEQVPT